MKLTPEHLADPWADLLRLADAALSAHDDTERPASVTFRLTVKRDKDTGKSVGMFAAKCMSFGEVEECLRLRFSPEIDAKIMKWMKKRKSSPSAYMMRDGAA